MFCVRWLFVGFHDPRSRGRFSPAQTVLVTTLLEYFQAKLPFNHLADIRTLHMYMHSGGLPLRQTIEIYMFGVIAVTKPCKYLWFRAIDVTKPYEFIWFAHGTVDGRN
jgi:hypothetical protein